jgi:hypothetical protein
VASTVLVAILALGLPGLAPAQGSDGAREIMRQVLRDSRAEDEVVNVSMQLVDARGRVRRRTATFYSKKRTAEDSVRLFRFYTPPEFSRSGILTIEHSDRDADQWIYLPAYYASRRVSSANRGDTWMGTDFTYEDIIDAKIEQYEYRTLRHEQLGNVQCVVIEAIPKEKKLVEESAYSKTVYWVNADEFVAPKVEYYNRAGRVFKILTNSDLRRLGKYRRWQRSEMHEVTQDHKTVLEFSDRKINKGLGDEYFEVSYLERGR